MPSRETPKTAKAELNLRRNPVCAILARERMSTAPFQSSSPNDSTAGNDQPAVDPFAGLLAKATYHSSGIGTNLSIRLERSAGVLVLRIVGTSSDSLPETFTGAVEQVLRGMRPPFAAVDLMGSQSLPSVILAFLVFFQKNAELNGTRKVVLYGANSRILTVIKMIGMLDFFVIKPDEAAMRQHVADASAAL